MKYRSFLLLVCVFSLLQAIAQQQVITCSTQKNPDGTLSINAESIAYVEYTLKLTLFDVDGYRSNVDLESIKSINPGTTEIARLTRTGTVSMPTFRYKTQFFPGKSLNHPPDTTFEYLLPSTANNILRVSKVYPIERRLGQKEPEDFFAIGFKYKLNDTICATRGGTVYECRGEMKEGEKTSQVYTSNRNRISIEHRDGTIGHYVILAPMKLLVNAGDVVIPGQPLAVFNTQSDKYHVMFSVTYIDNKELLAHSTPPPGTPPPYIMHVPIRFYISDDKTEVFTMNKEYKVLQPKQVIAAELSRKEKKKYGL